MAMNTKTFIERAVAVHGDRYFYDKTEFNGWKSKVILTCKEHGDFEQRPDAHLAGNGCRFCAQQSSTKEFVDKAVAIHGERYDYSKVVYKTAKTKVTIICPEHGEFTQTPNNHLSGFGCNECGNVQLAKAQALTTEDVINRLRDRYGDVYDYSKVVYKNNRTSMTLICPVHGEFEIRPDCALRPDRVSACAQCSYEAMEGGYNQKTVERNPDMPITLYVVECTGHGETFIKVGLTKNGKDGNRFASVPYDIKFLATKEGRLGELFPLEQYMINISTGYNPSKFFGGYTECLHADSTPRLLNLMDV